MGYTDMEAIYLFGYIEPIEDEWRAYASGNYTIIGSDKGLSPVRRLAIIETNAGVLSIGPWEQISMEL